MLTTKALAEALDVAPQEILFELLPSAAAQRPRIVKRKMSNYGVKRASHGEWPQPARRSADAITALCALSKRYGPGVAGVQFKRYAGVRCVRHAGRAGPGHDRHAIGQGPAATARDQDPGSCMQGRPAARLAEHTSFAFFGFTFRARAVGGDNKSRVTGDCYARIGGARAEMPGLSDRRLIHSRAA